jgi:EAL domain-containing protein (putative c-di-GMP-specific phosphodiesterase class I)
VDRLLIVDDDPNVLAGLHRVAGRHFQIDGVTSGETAVARLLAGARYDAIVSDMMMTGIDGIVFLERAREIAAATPRIMLTGHADRTVLLDAINRAHVAGFLQKPAPAAELIAAIRQAIADARAGRMTPPSALTQRQDWIAAELARADFDAQFRILFQPRICAATGAMASSEVLLRWTHPVQGPISPLEFIPVAEATGRIDDVTAWVLRQAARGWRMLAEGGLDLSVSVNAPISTISSPRFVDMVAGILSEEGMPANRLEIEITESNRLEKADTVREVVDGLREMGTRIALDDFGTGYSFFETLRWLNIDSLKVDRSFVMTLAGHGKNGKNEKIVASIVDLADSLHLTVIAEGVETREQVDLLRGLGVRQLQGFFFAAPMPPDELMRAGLARRDHRRARSFGDATRDAVA